ncbi:MAG: hypothetical protein AAB316_18565, partial [Bacteroidota bacterium]
LAGAILGAFLGLLLMLNALQFYLDLQRLLSGDANAGDQFVQVNKKVNLFNTLGVSSAFSAKEIAEIERQPFVEKAGVFTSNQFRTTAYSDMLGFYTELFFEALPAEFLDVDEPKFRWSEGQNEIPVIISKDYLALYNFGFAPSQGLPQVTASTIKKLVMDVKISGNGREVIFQGRIVGFSERINSILVPQAFMDWANQHFSSKQLLEPQSDKNPLEGAGGDGAARLILKVDNPMAKDFQAFLKEKNLEVSTGRLIGGQFGVLFQAVLAVVAAFGGLILLLSALVFVLNFQLLVAQNASEIKLLLEIGYKQSVVAGVLSKRFAWMLTGLLLAVFAALLTGRYFLVKYFENQGFEMKTLPDGWVWMAAIGIGILLLALNFSNIRRSVARLF